MVSAILEYLQGNWPNLLRQLGTHLWVSLLALALAAAIGIPCGYLASKSPKSERWVTGPFQVLRVVPSLALLILLIPIMGTGVPPAVTALTVLAIPPILLNTIAGFREVPDFMLETGRVMGMTDSELLWKVRVPLAMPLLLAL